MTTITQSLGHQFAEAIAAKDPEALTSLLAPGIDFRAVTPRRAWEETSATGVLDVVLGHWFDENDRIDALVQVTEGDDVEDTHQVGYRLAVTTPDGPHTVEQQAYYRTSGDRIDYLRVVCSGFRPAQ